MTTFSTPTPTGEVTYQFVLLFKQPYVGSAHANMMTLNVQRLGDATEPESALDADILALLDAIRSLDSIHGASVTKLSGNQMSEAVEL